MVHAVPKIGINGSPDYMCIAFTLVANDSPAYMDHYIVHYSGAHKNQNGSPAYM